MCCLHMVDGDLMKHVCTVKELYYGFEREWRDCIDGCIKKKNSIQSLSDGVFFLFGALDCSFHLTFLFPICFFCLSLSLYLSFIIAFCFTVCYYKDDCSLLRFRLTGPGSPVWKPKKRPRCLATSLYNLVMHSLKVLQKHLHLVLLLSPVILLEPRFSSGTVSFISLWKPRWSGLTRNVLQHSQKPCKIQRLCSLPVLDGSEKKSD